MDLAPDPAKALLALATGGDDYEIACAIAPGSLQAVLAATREACTALTMIGRFEVAPEVDVRIYGDRLEVAAAGYQHR